MTLRRIYFDTNEGDGTGDDIRYDLGLRRSREDIAAISDQLQEGMRVIIYMTGELEMEATSSPLAFRRRRTVVSTTTGEHEERIFVLTELP
jgi:hypothetical protein